VQHTLSTSIASRSPLHNAQMESGTYSFLFVSPLQKAALWMMHGLARRDSCPPSSYHRRATDQDRVFFFLPSFRCLRGVRRRGGSGASRSAYDTARNSFFPRGRPIPPFRGRLKTHPGRTDRPASLPAPPSSPCKATDNIYFSLPSAALVELIRACRSFDS